MGISGQMVGILEIVQIIFQFLFFVVKVYNVIFFIWILSSWLPVNRSILILRFVDNLINPVYYGLLSILPPIRLGIIDFSPFYMFIFLYLVEFAIRITHNLVIQLVIRLFS